MDRLPKALLEKLNNIPMENWEEVLRNPQKYGITVYEFLMMGQFLSDIAKSMKESTQTPDEKYAELYNEYTKLQNDYKKLKAKLDKYEYLFSDIREAKALLCDAIEDFE